MTGVGNGYVGVHRLKLVPLIAHGLKLTQLMKHRRKSVPRRSVVRRRQIVVGWCACVVWLGFAGEAMGQHGKQVEEEHVVTIRGVVVNSVTGGVVSRALVTSPGDEYAAMTDDTGRFELKIHQRVPPAPPGATVQSSQSISARKNGYLRSSTVATTQYGGDSGLNEEAEITIRLVPEALVVGHVDVPGSEGNVRIECGLLRREMVNGKERWTSEERIMTWADGEFRFSELKAGVYKLITHEQLDPESRTADPGQQQYGYPPVYYPNTRDFSEAGKIVLKAGETAQLNLTVERQAYYPVSIAVKNPPAKGATIAQVWPAEARGPGWTLSYDEARGMIEGSLPTGNYTVQATSTGDGGWVGLGNFAVKNKPLDGGFLTMAPMAEVQANVHTDFQHGHMATTDGMPPNARRTNVMPVNRLVQLRLVSTENTTGSGMWGASPKSDSSPSLVFENLPPGRYVLQARGASCYVASAESGGVDLLHQPLVVGGGSVAPIEVTLKDDGGEIDVTAEDTSTGDGNGQGGATSATSGMVSVHLLPTSEWGGGPIGGMSAGTVQMTQVPPGDYLVLVFGDADPPDLPYGNLELMQGWVNRGEIVHVEAGQRVSATVKLIRGEAGGSQ